MKKLSTLPRRVGKKIPAGIDRVCIPSVIKLKEKKSFWMPPMRAYTSKVLGTSNINSQVNLSLHAHTSIFLLLN